MNAQDTAKVEKWLSDHGVRECPACRQPALAVKPQVAVLVPIIGDKWITPEVAQAMGLPGLPSLPLVTVMCENCGHALHFGARMMGVS